MQIQGPAHLHGPQPINAPHRTNTPRPAQPTGDANLSGTDQVDISQEANLASRIRDLPEIRHDLVARIRGEIEAGSYETDEKLDTAVTRLLEEIG